MPVRAQFDINRQQKTPDLHQIYQLTFFKATVKCSGGGQMQSNCIRTVIAQLLAEFLKIA